MNFVTVKQYRAAVEQIRGVTQTFHALSEAGFEHLLQVSTHSIDAQVMLANSQFPIVDAYHAQLEGIDAAFGRLNGLALQVNLNNAAERLKEVCASGRAGLEAMQAIAKAKFTATYG